MCRVVVESDEAVFLVKHIQGRGFSAEYCFQKKGQDCNKMRDKVG